MKSYIIKESQLRNLLEGLEFAQVYSDTYDNVFKFVCMRFANRDKDLAKDYCQVGYMKVMDKLNTYSGQGSLEGWVKKVVTNTIINELRKRQLDTTSNVDLERTDIEDVQYDLNPDFFEGRLTASQLRRAVNELPEGYRKVMYLYFFKNLSHEEIGELMGINPGTSRSQLHKGKNILRKIIGDYLKLSEE